MKKFTVRPRYAGGNGYLLGGGAAEQWIYLGRLAEMGPLVDVRFEVGHPHVIAIFGKRGSGKSYTMGSMLEGYCTEQPQSSISSIRRDTGVLLLDTLGIFQWTDIGLSDAADSEVLRRQRDTWRGWSLTPDRLDVQVWIPKGTRSEQTPASHKEFTIRTADFGADDWGYLLNLDIYQDRMGQLLSDAYIKVVVEGWQGEGGHREPKSLYSLKDLVDCVRMDSELDATYQAETRRGVMQQLSTFARNPLFESAGTALTELMAPGRMNVLVMNHISVPLRLVILSALTRRLMDERMRASETEKNLLIRRDLGPAERQRLEDSVRQAVPRTLVALDEAQNVLPSERKTAAGEMLVRFVREGRNYGLSFMVATQQPLALDSRILAQVDTLIAHKLTVQSDIDYISRNLKSNMPDEVMSGGKALSFMELIRGLEVGQALVSNTEADRSLLVEIRPRVSVHGGF